MTEIWKDVAGCGSAYQVSSLGRIKNTNTGKILTPNKHKSGYLRIELGYGINRICRVHRLVAEAFIPNAEGKPEVNHIDGNKENNSAGNLEWVTPRENTQHAMRIGHFKRFSVEASNGVTYSSTKEAQRALGIHSSSISKVCRGIYRQYKGMRFRYIDQPAEED